MKLRTFLTALPMAGAACADPAKNIDPWEAMIRRTYGHEKAQRIIAFRRAEPKEWHELNPAERCGYVARQSVALGVTPA